ncbi:ABC transporter permease [Spirillospora sp. NPDC049652]
MTSGRAAARPGRTARDGRSGSGPSSRGRSGGGRSGAGGGVATAVRTALWSGFGRVWLFVLLAGLWELASRTSGSAFFPPPSQIVRATAHLWFDGPPAHLMLNGTALDDFKPSLTDLFTGWAIAAVGGVVLGVAIGVSRTVAGLLNPALQFFRSVPPPTLIPFLLALLDIGGPMQITVIAYGAVWPVLLNTIDGVRAVEPLHVDSARVFGLSPAARLLRVTLPSATPKIFAGLRTSLGFALIIMVISELVGQGQGIGAHIIDAQQQFQIPEMWAGILLLGVLGCLFNLLFHLVESRVLAWHAGARRNDTREA